MFTGGRITIDGVAGVNRVQALYGYFVDGSALTQPTESQRATVGTQTNVASSGSPILILAGNASRIGATIFNDSTQILYLLVTPRIPNSSVPSTSNYTVQIPSNKTYEVPLGYIGEIQGVWASADGFARVTEFT